MVKIVTDAAPGIVMEPDGNILNEDLLIAGLAWHYLKYDQNYEWDKLEDNARTNKIGLLRDPHAMAPWVW
jgi:micrococcal nuclease